MSEPRRGSIEPNVTFKDQLASSEDGPIVLLNIFTVAPEDMQAMLDIWGEDSGVMKRQPGFISAQLHKGVAGTNVFVNYAIWESIEAFRNAHKNPEFQAVIARTPASAVTQPMLLKKIAVPGVCVA